MPNQATKITTIKGAADRSRPGAVSLPVWQSILDFFQIDPPSGQPADEGECIMNEYREFVAKVADSTWPSETIANRSWEHASVIIEFLFRKSETNVEILTSKLTESVYSCPPLVAAAKDFLRDHPQAIIKILSENKIERGAHPFLIAMDAEGFAGRVALKFIGANMHSRYKFNFAVADGKSFRFEDSRESFEAVVGFGHEKLASRLHVIFTQLWNAA
jgi:hypothetical protein